MTKRYKIEEVHYADGSVKYEMYVHEFLWVWTRISISGIEIASWDKPGLKTRLVNSVQMAHDGCRRHFNNQLSNTKQSVTPSFHIISNGH